MRANHKEHTPWPVSARRRCFILQRYGRGPRKKPPDKPPPPLGRKTTLTVATQCTITLKPRRDCRYNRCRRAIPNPLCGSRAVAPFLAGSRRPLHRISPKYSPARSSGKRHHGYNLIPLGFFTTLTPSRWATIIFMWFSFIVYSHEVQCSTQRPILPLFGVMSSIFLDLTFHLVKLYKKFKACTPRNKKAPHFSNFRHEKHTFSDVPSIQDIPYPQKGERVSHFSFYKFSKAVITSLTVWATAHHLLQLFDSQHRHRAKNYMNNASSHTSSVSLLNSSHNSPDSVISKPFFTRTSSIADDETTLCPSIPNSISFRSLDDLTVGSDPSIDLFYTCETQKHANMSIGNPDSSPINHEAFEDRPPPEDSDNEADDNSTNEDNSANEVHRAETASTEGGDDTKVIDGTSVNHRAAQAAKKASPTTPIKLFQQFEVMMAKMQDICSPNSKNPSKNL